MYTYRDFATGKTKRTRGKFAGWTGPQGPLDVRYAIFANRASNLFVPVYCLTAETREALPKPPDSEEPEQTGKGKRDEEIHQT